MRKAFLVPVAAFAVAFSTAAWAEPQQLNVPAQRTPMIEVSGTGSVQVKPDIAVIRIGVATEDANAEAAVAKNSAATAKVLSEVAAAGIEKKDLQTSQFSLYPQTATASYPRKDGAGITTFRASNTVSVTVRNLDRLGEILGASVAAGSNRISGPDFAVSEPEKYLGDARRKAVEAALAKAKTYAEAAGMKLGAVLSIAEDGAGSPAPVFRGAAYAKAQSVPVEVGEETLSAQVRIAIELIKP
ncbi:SIMPL domain-containing protein [Rhodomicrobium sp. Az07]|uniref:SIMPL domain-containing protein n=1 Tax=Rhodomicrobium sp. Az07 TaxID=2839034 RepID=UPI001BE51F9D|nr:SIMPL domain-containing protein [Rhodomicrobium sp. Az07]MBT3070543.1 SIMPL domain-containing protein [Rhodomicrobium sp. Az07]